MVTSVEIVVANCNYSPAQRQKKKSFFFQFLSLCVKLPIPDGAHYVMLYFKGKHFLKLLKKMSIKEIRAAEGKVMCYLFLQLVARFW